MLHPVFFWEAPLSASRFPAVRTKKQSCLLPLCEARSFTIVVLLLSDEQSESGWIFDQGIDFDFNILGTSIRVHHDFRRYNLLGPSGGGIREMTDDCTRNFLVPACTIPVQFVGPTKEENVSIRYSYRRSKLIVRISPYHGSPPFRTVYRCYQPSLDIIDCKNCF